MTFKQPRDGSLDSNLYIIVLNNRIMRTTIDHSCFVKLKGDTHANKPVETYSLLKRLPNCCNCKKIRQTDAVVIV